MLVVVGSNWAPGGGSVSITVPSGSLLGREEPAGSRDPSATGFRRADRRAWPITFGIWTVVTGGALATVMSTESPLARLVPAVGSWASTVPGARLLVSRVETVPTVRPLSASAWPAWSWESKSRLGPSTGPGPLPAEGSPWAGR